MRGRIERDKQKTVSRGRLEHSTIEKELVAMYNDPMPHIHDKIDFTAEVFIVHNNKVLLRKHDKYKIWLSVGGHIELDENPIEAAIREVKEEVGLDVRIAGAVPDFSGMERHGIHFQEIIPPKFLNHHDVSDTHQHVTMIYFGSSATDQIAQGDGEVSDACKWFSASELDDPQYEIRDNIKHYAHAALKELSSHTI